MSDLHNGAVSTDGPALTYRTQGGKDDDNDDY